MKAGLDQDVCLGVLEPVPVGEPVTWCHRMVVCTRKNGSPNVLYTKKTVLYARNGNHSVPIHPNDQHLTTFITPWGRYRYKIAPQGYIASGDGYTRRYDEVVADIPNKTKCIDDVLIWAHSIEDSFFKMVQWLDICGRNGIVLNPEKFVFPRNAVEFAGFRNQQEQCPFLCQVYTVNIRIPDPSKHHRCSLVVWYHQSSVIRL